MYWKCTVVALVLSLVIRSEAQPRTASPPVGPRIGIVRCSDGSLRNVYGLPANLLYGALLGRGVTVAAFSDVSGLVLRNGQIEYLATDGSSLGEYTTDESKPLLAVGPGSTAPGASSQAALAWLPLSHLLLTWSGPTLRQVEVVPLPGEVVSLSPASSGFAALMVASTNGIVERLIVSLTTGQFTETSVMAGAIGSAYEQNGFVLLPGADGLQVRSPDGRQQLLRIKTAAVQFEPISNEWVQVSTPRNATDLGSHWLLHLAVSSPGDMALQLSELPGPPAKVPKVMPRQVGNLMMRVAQ